MTEIDIQTEENLRQVFKKFNPYMVWLWRLGFRRWINSWPGVGGRIMVITHTGRKSGLRRQTPLNYAIVDGELYCTAGFGSQSDWYRNILAHPQVEVWLPDGWWAGLAEDASQDARRLALLRQVIIASGVVAPLMGINPHRLSDDEFARVMDGYQLIHIRRTTRLSGSGGPGDLAWIWAPVLLAALLLLFARRRLRK